MRRLVLALGSMVLFASCVAFNDQCQALVADPAERVAFIARGTELYLDRPNARHNPNALGQAAADAFSESFSLSPRPADFGVINGGSLRSEAICGASRTIIREGPLTNGVLHEIILFENLISAVDLTEDEVIKLFEHSVQQLFAEGVPIISPAGQFLQVSKQVAVEIDCAQPAGMRITSLKIKGEVVQRPGRDGKKYRVALPNFLLSGGDGYSVLVAPGKDPDRNPAQAQSFGGVDSNITADFLRKTYNKDLDTGLKVDPARMLLKNCAKAVRPTN